MPGKPLPARAPSTPTVSREVRDLERAVEQLDRRLARQEGGELFAHVAPDPPAHKRGRLWLKTDEPVDGDA